MDDINQAPTEFLEALKAVLNHQEKPAIERLATVACLFLVAIIDEELRKRKK